MTHQITAGSPRLLRRLNAAAVLRTIRAEALRAVEERLFDVAMTEAV